MKKRFVWIGILVVLLCFSVGKTKLNISTGNENKPFLKIIEQKDGKIHAYEKMISSKGFQLQEWENVSKEIPILIMGEEGGYSIIRKQGIFEQKNGDIIYRGPDGKTLQKVKGIWIDPPKGSVMDVYQDSLKALKQDKKVMVIYLDGFGYHQYDYAVAKGYAPFLQKFQNVKKATTVYQPVTNAGFAAMITGKSPAENGVYSRAQTDMKKPSLFAETKKIGKKALLIEGDIKILNTEIDPVLNIDKNKDGFTDNEVFECAMKSLSKGYDFMLVHFHGIDDCGHRYGDRSEETMHRIQIVDTFVEQLVSNWDGEVIITADHGMHTTKEGGSHGEFRSEDLLVPYIKGEGVKEK